MAMSPIAATFAHHVEVDDGVLATSAPLELQSLDKIILLVADGLQKNPEMSRVARQYHEQLVIQRVIHIVDAVSGMLMLLQNHSEAQAFFKESIVKGMFSLPVGNVNIHICCSSYRTRSTVATPII